MGRRGWLVGLGLLVMVAAAIGWWQRTSILAWYHVRQLCAANEEDRDAWVQRVAGLDTAAVPGLLEALGRSDERACANAAAALLALVDAWGPDDRRSLSLVEDVRGRFSQWSPAGRASAMQAPMRVLATGAGALSSALSQTTTDIVVAAAATGEPGIVTPTLSLAAALVERGAAGPARDTCRDLAVKYLPSADPDQRVAAIYLLARLADAAPALLTRVLPSLRDAAAPVRRAAVAVLGRARDVLTDEEVLPLLHDGDAEVRRLAELALRSRAFPENHIVLARLISDPDPAGRLQVFEALQQAPDLDAAVWLRRLTEDPESAIRAAAIRAACQDFRVNLAGRLQQMASADPSETVRGIARIYLNLPLARLEN